VVKFGSSLLFKKNCPALEHVLNLLAVDVEMKKQKNFVWKRLRELRKSLRNQTRRAKTLRDHRRSICQYLLSAATFSNFVFIINKATTRRGEKNFPALDSKLMSRSAGCDVISLDLIPASEHNK
jgi:ADP-heptose:LPS heptosyltransferase